MASWGLCLAAPACVRRPRATRRRLQACWAPHRHHRGVTAQVKNAIIGNKRAKGAYREAGAVPQVVQLLLRASSTADVDLLVQAAATLGSLCCDNSDAVQQAVEHEGVQALTQVLLQADAIEPRAVEAVVRTLKLMCQASVTTNCVWGAIASAREAWGLPSRASSCSVGPGQQV